MEKMNLNNAVKTYDAYGDFSINLFFAVKYNLNPSKVSVYLDVEEVKENYLKAIEAIDFDSYDLVQHFCKWTKSKNKSNTDEDYVYFSTFYAKEVPLCLEIELNNDELSLECYYDWNNDEIERWAIDQVDRIRNIFGSEKSPEFNILTREQNEFETSKIKIKPVDIDFDLNYNSNFKQVNEIIEKSFEEEKSGLILLYGEPGTGKTTYIKYLVQKFSQNKFVFIPNDFIQDLLKPSFISFLVKQINAVLVIEDAEKVISNREEVGGPSVVSTLLQLTDGLFSDYLKTKVICTFNTDTSKIDKALFRKGRMIASYEFDKLKIDKLDELSEKFDLDIKEEITIGDVYNAKESKFIQKGNSKIGFKK